MSNQRETRLLELLGKEGLGLTENGSVGLSLGGLKLTDLVTGRMIMKDNSRVLNALPLPRQLGWLYFTPEGDDKGKTDVLEANKRYVLLYKEHRQYANKLLEIFNEYDLKFGGQTGIETEQKQKA